MPNAFLFLRTDQTNKDGTNTVYLRVIIRKRKKDIATPVRTFARYWNEKHQRISARDWESQQKNLVLDTYIRRAKEIIYRAYIEEKDLTIDEFYRLFKHQYNKTDIFDFINLVIDKYDLSKETKKFYRAQANKLKNFRGKIFIEDIDKEFISEYKYYLIQRGNGKNTISKALAFLKSILNKAIEHQIIKENPFVGIKLTKIEGNREFLTRNEIDILHRYYKSTENKTHKKVLRYFLFNCFVGLRYLDLKNLRWENIKEIEIDNQIYKYIEIQMHKTKHLVTVPLTDFALKFLPERPEIDKAKVFRVFTNQVTNRYLQSIAKITGTKKHITTHTARHTFATLSIEAGIPIEVVSELLGHTQLKTTQIYAKITMNKKFKEIRKIKF